MGWRNHVADGPKDVVARDAQPNAREPTPAGSRLHRAPEHLYNEQRDWPSQTNEGEQLLLNQSLNTHTPFSSELSLQPLPPLPLSEPAALALSDPGPPQAKTKLQKPGFFGFFFHETCRVSNVKVGPEPTLNPSKTKSIKS